MRSYRRNAETQPATVMPRIQAKAMMIALSVMFRILYANFPRNTAKAVNYDLPSSQLSPSGLFF